MRYLAPHFAQDAPADAIDDEPSDSPSRTTFFVQPTLLIVLVLLALVALTVLIVVYIICCRRGFRGGKYVWKGKQYDMAALEEGKRRFKQRRYKKSRKSAMQSTTTPPPGTIIVLQPLPQIQEQPLYNGVSSEDETSEEDERQRRKRRKRKPKQDLPNTIILPPTLTAGGDMLGVNGQSTNSFVDPSEQAAHNGGEP